MGNAGGQMRRIATVSLLLLAGCSGDLVPRQAGDDGSSVGSRSSAVTSMVIPCNGSDVTTTIQGALDDGAAVACADPDMHQMIDVKLTAGTCVVSSTLRACFDHTTIRGAGPNVTVVDFRPAASTEEVLFKFQGPNAPSTEGEFSPLRSNALKDLGIRSDSGYDQQKTAVYVHDARNFLMENVVVGPWMASSYATTGIELRGRDLGLFRKLRIEASVPIRIAQNVNEGYDPADPNSPRYRDITKDIDHHHFEDLTLTSIQAPSPVVKIQSEVVMRNVVFDGHQSWTGGGLYWVDIAHARRHSNQLRLSNLRVEGLCASSCGGQWAIRIDKDTTAWPVEDPPTGDSVATPQLEELLVESSVLGDASAQWGGVRAMKRSGTDPSVDRTILRQVALPPNDVQTDGALFRDP